ncbi:MAG: radical SAM family heme chaperone HemW [Pseudomonadota bacterium]|nr:radical SAM family heme chaperone HemW [Pseudomonadota bacterium]
MQKNLAIYVHWPFCQSKCPYCDFNSHVAAAVDHEQWRASYREELAHYADILPARVITSVFFGGGTPSLMEPRTVQVIIDEIARLWPLGPDLEITLEANPTSVEAEKFAGFRKAGVGRLSLGVQSLDNQALAFLGRAHNSDQARRAIELAERYFPRFSFDLIYARKDQTPDLWERELREALTLTKGHISLYQLTIEPNTAFHTQAGRGVKLTAPDDLSATMFEQTQIILREAGMPAYEISNHARPGDESRHNLTYWRYEDYIGIGPGAHGRYVLNGDRLAADNHRAPDVWLREVGMHKHGRRDCLVLDTLTAQREALLMGLRLSSGIASMTWHERFGMGLDAFIPQQRIRRLADEGYLEYRPEALRATPAGLQRLNAVLSYLLA